MPDLQPETGAGVVWLSDRVLAALRQEAGRAAPLETGGVLLGYRAGDRGGPVITHAVGPGPGAVHERHRFVPDHEYQLSEIARLYQESGRLLDYLGDWHTHPGGDAYLSETDRVTLNRIATAGSARAPMPVMLVLAPGPAWEPTAWCGTAKGRTRLYQRLVTWSLEVRQFEATVSGCSG